MQVMTMALTTDARAASPSPGNRVRWPRSGQAGFTLIELLVTATIVSVLAAMAVPKFMSAIDKAKQGRAIAEIVVIRDAVETHRVLHNGNLPANMAELVPDNLGTPPLDPWNNPYIFNNFKLIQPADKRMDVTAPINQEYDIFSKGENGLFSADIQHGTSRDDIFMARDGGYVGTVANY